MRRFLNVLRWLCGTATPRCSAIWLRDQLRREGAAGIEQSCISWPIKTLLNNSALWNTHKLKRKAS